MPNTVETVELSYIIKNQLELNLSYMPFINNGGLFIPTTQSFSLGDKIVIDLQLPGHNEPQKIEGKVIWIAPKNALHHIYQGIGVQFVGANAKSLREQIEANLDNTMEIGGYTYGIMSDITKPK